MPDHCDQLARGDHGEISRRDSPARESGTYPDATPGSAPFRDELRLRHRKSGSGLSRHSDAVTPNWNRASWPVRPAAETNRRGRPTLHPNSEKDPGGKRMASLGISRPSKWKVGFAALVVVALAIG